MSLLAETAAQIPGAPHSYETPSIGVIIFILIVGFIFGSIITYIISAQLLVVLIYTLLNY